LKSFFHERKNLNIFQPTCSLFLAGMTFRSPPFVRNIPTLSIYFFFSEKERDTN
jgi:hypothetical protein